VKHGTGKGKLEAYQGRNELWEKLLSNGELQFWIYNKDKKRWEQAYLSVR